MFELVGGFGFTEARLEMVLAEARLVGRTKGWLDLSVVAPRVGVAVGGGMVRDWRLGFDWMEGVPLPVVGPFSRVGVGARSGREAAPLMVLSLVRLRLLRTVTVAGMLVPSIGGPVLGDDLGGVLVGAGNLDFAVCTRSVRRCILPWRL